MKILNVALLALVVLGVGLVGCEDPDRGLNYVYVNVPDPVVTNTNVVTPGGLTIVEVVDPNGKLQDPNSGITQDLLNKDLDYQVLYVWYQRELNETGVDFKTWAKSARFHLIVDTSFKVNKDRNVHYAVLPAGFDVYIAALRQSSDGHYCADAEPSMDLLSGDVSEGHDRHPGTDFLLFTAPAYPTTGYLSLQ